MIDLWQSLRWIQKVILGVRSLGGRYGAEIRPLWL
jgi:hypothetical protein